MPIFDQRNQKVTYQFNAGGDINFGAVQDKLGFIGQMKELNAEVQRAAQAGVISTEVALEVATKINNATSSMQETNPDKKTILDYLTEAKTLIEGITSATGLVTALVQACEVVKRIL